MMVPTNCRHAKGSKQPISTWCTGTEKKTEAETETGKQTHTHTHTSRYTNKQTNTHTHTHKQTHTHRVPQQARTWNVERLALLHVAADRRRLRNQRVLVQISIVEVHLPNVGLEKWRNGEMEREKQRRIRLSL